MIRYVLNTLTAAIKDRKGVTALEYGVLAVAIIGGVSVAATSLGTSLSGLFSRVGASL